MCQSPDVRLMEAPGSPTSIDGDGSFTAKLLSQGLSTIGTEASLNLRAQRRPIFDVDRETLLREEAEESEVQLFLFPNPTPRSPPPPPLSGVAGAPRRSHQGMPPLGASPKVFPSTDSKPGRKAPRGLAMGILQQDVAGVLNLHSDAANGKGSKGTEDAEGGGGSCSVDEDLELQALESKLELITLQRNVSAVKCEIFLDILEAHRRKGRQLPGMPMPSGVPPALPKSSSRSSRGGERGSSDPPPSSTKSHRNLNPDGPSPRGRKLRASKTSNRHGRHLPRAKSLHKTSWSGVGDAGSLLSPLHPSGCPVQSYYEGYPEGSLGLQGSRGILEGAGLGHQVSTTSRRCYTPQHHLSRSAHHALPHNLGLSSNTPSPRQQTEVPSGRPFLPSSSSLGGHPTDSGPHPTNTSASNCASTANSSSSSNSAINSINITAVGSHGISIGDGARPMDSVLQNHSPGIPQGQRKSRPPHPMPATPAPPFHMDRGADPAVTVSAVPSPSLGTGAYPSITVAGVPKPLSASPGRGNGNLRTDDPEEVLGSGDAPAVQFGGAVGSGNVPVVQFGGAVGSGNVPAVQFGGAMGSGRVGAAEGLMVHSPQSTGCSANTSPGSGGLWQFEHWQGGLSGQASPLPSMRPMFTGRFSPGQIVPMLFTVDGELDPCPSPDDGPRLAPGFENLPKLPPPSYPAPPTPNMEAQGELGRKATPSFSLLDSLPPLPMLSLPIPDLGGSLANWSQKALPHLAHPGGADAGDVTFPQPQFDFDQVVPPLPKPTLYHGSSAGKGLSSRHAHKGAAAHAQVSAPSAAGGMPLVVPAVVSAGGPMPGAGSNGRLWGGPSQGPGGSAWDSATGAACLQVPAV